MREDGGKLRTFWVVDSTVSKKGGRGLGDAGRVFVQHAGWSLRS